MIEHTSKVCLLTTAPETVAVTMEGLYSVKPPAQYAFGVIQNKHHHCKNRHHHGKKQVCHGTKQASSWYKTGLSWYKTGIIMVQNRHCHGMLQKAGITTDYFPVAVTTLACLALAKHD